MSPPTLYVTSWEVAHAAARGGDPSLYDAYLGPRRMSRWTIMAMPGLDQRGRGRVVAATPAAKYAGVIHRLVKVDRDDEATRAQFFAALREDYAAECWRPGELLARTWSGEWVPVADGDALLCACSLANGRRGACHRNVLAPFLLANGWRVVLDAEARAPAT